MAQWSRADRTLYAKIVYYGPAFGGKTTNLEALHRITDPRGTQQLVSVNTAKDRTLFFDLLPLDLGEILGHQVAMKLYTVPGQVRYDTTRQVVLSGSDAVVFVADSTASREEQNRWSLHNLKMNMRAKQLDPAEVPVVFQFNKQDLPEAAPPAEVARWLGIQPGQGVSAVATRGEGVVETLIAVSRLMLARLIAQADGRTQREIDPDALENHLERAFAPFLSHEAASRATEEQPYAAGSAVVVDGDDLLRDSLEANIKLGERLSAETQQAVRFARETEALRGLSDSLRRVGASFDSAAIEETALGAAAQTLNSPAASLIRRRGVEDFQVCRVRGRPDDPLAACDAGRRLLERMIAPGSPCVVPDLASECPDATAGGSLEGLRAAVSLPVVAQGALTMLVYAAQPDGAFHEEDVRFLVRLASHLEVGLEKAGLYAELDQNRQRLELAVQARTKELQEAYAELRLLELSKDRFLGGLSHEMKTPLTGILSSGIFLRDYGGGPAEREELVETIIKSAEALQKLLDDLFRVVTLGSGSGPMHVTETDTDALLRSAIALSGHDPALFRVRGAHAVLRADANRVSRALANLLDNAVKFSPPAPEVEVEIQKARFRREGQTMQGLAISVLDRGAGVAEQDRGRLFRPFEQGGDPLVGKPAGVGIGLHEARMIARRHGGQLDYQPRSGGGSVFRLCVPLEPVLEPCAHSDALEPTPDLAPGAHEGSVADPGRLAGSERSR